LRERGGIVGAITGHRDQLAFALLTPDQVHLVFRGRLSEEVIDACLAGDSGGRERIVAGNHYGANAHRSELTEALSHPTLHDVFEFDHAERAAFAFSDDERCPAGARDLIYTAAQFVWESRAILSKVAFNGVHSAFADLE